VAVKTWKFSDINIDWAVVSKVSLQRKIAHLLFPGRVDEIILYGRVDYVELTYGRVHQSRHISCWNFIVWIKFLKHISSEMRKLLRHILIEIHFFHLLYIQFGMKKGGILPCIHIHVCMSVCMYVEYVQRWMPIRMQPTSLFHTCCELTHLVSSFVHTRNALWRFEMDRRNCQHTSKTKSLYSQIETFRIVLKNDNKDFLRFCFFPW